MSGGGFSMGKYKKLGVVVLGGALLIGGFSGGVANNIERGTGVFGLSEVGAATYQKSSTKDTIAKKEKEIKDLEWRIDKANGTIRSFNNSIDRENKNLIVYNKKKSDAYRNYKSVEAREKKLGKRGSAKKVLDAKVAYENSAKRVEISKNTIANLKAKRDPVVERRNADMKRLMQLKSEVSKLKKSSGSR